jgi:hypothetical protein
VALVEAVLAFLSKQAELLGIQIERAKLENFLVHDLKGSRALKNIAVHHKTFGARSWEECWKLSNVRAMVLEIWLKTDAVLGLKNRFLRSESLYEMDLYDTLGEAPQRKDRVGADDDDGDDDDDDGSIMKLHWPPRLKIIKDWSFSSCWARWLFYFGCFV